MKASFLPHAALKPQWAPWTAQDSIFSISHCELSDLVTWAGLNDVGRWKNAEKQLTSLFEGQELLYDAGARNFLFITLPPIDKSPTGNTLYDDINDRRGT
jgi:hypothetical protein